MCRPASFVVTKDRVYWSKRSDSHEEIIREFKLEVLDRDAIRGSNLVRIEIVPPNDNDFETPLDKWVFHTDQIVTPDWYVAESAEKECRVALEQWAKAKLCRVGEVREIKEGEFLLAVCGGTISAVRGGTISAVCGGTISEVWGGTISAVCGGTISEVWGGTISAVRGGTISAVWGGTISAVRGGTISAVWGGTISAVRGGMLRFFCKFSVKISGKYSVAVDMTGDKAKCYVGTEKSRIIKGGK